MIILITILLAIITSSFVLSTAGIMGPNLDERTYIFEPGKVIEHSFKISGSPHLESYIKGDLAPYATLIDQAQNSSSRSISIKLVLPEELSGGKHYLYVGCMEAAPKGVMMGGRAAAQMMIRVINLFPEPTIESKVSAKDSAIGSNSEATVTVKSLSKDIINDIYSEIKVVDLENSSKVYSELTTNTISLNSLQEGSLKTILPSAELKRGTYKVIAKTHYGYKDDVQVKKTSFRVGDNNITLNSYTSKLEEKKINKASFTIRNEWNEPINCYLELLIDGKKIGTTATKKISPFTNSNFELFIDTDDYDVGLKKGLLKGYYEGKVSEFEVEFNITKEQLPETNVPKKPESALSKYKVLIVANILVILLVIINLLVLMKKKK